MWIHCQECLDHCSRGSMSGCSTGSARCRWAARWCRAPAPRCAARTWEAGGPPCRSACRRGRSGGGRCSGTSYCGSGSGSACSPRPRTPQSANHLFKRNGWILQHYLLRCHLICDLWATPDKASLLGDRHQGHGVPVNCHRLVTVRVPEDDVGDPELANLTTIMPMAYEC